MYANSDFDNFRTNWCIGQEDLVEVRIHDGGFKLITHSLDVDDIGVRLAQVPVVCPDGDILQEFSLSCNTDGKQNVP